MIHTLKFFILFAGVIHLCIAAANFFLPAILRYRENLDRVEPIIRQVFLVHSLYIVIVLFGFAGLCFFFADDLAGATAIGRVTAGFLSVFWLLRVAIQAGFYDPAVKKTHRVFNLLFITAFLYLGIIFGIASLHP